MIIYSKEKKELVIPTGFDVDCSEAVEAAREEGYGLGFTSGQQSVRAHIESMYDSPEWDETISGIINYTPENGVEAWSSVTIDYNNIHNEGLEEGYNSGYESGYNSGLNEGYSNGYNSGYTTGYDSASTFDVALQLKVPAWEDFPDGPQSYILNDGRDLKINGKPYDSSFVINWPSGVDYDSYTFTTTVNIYDSASSISFVVDSQTGVIPNHIFGSVKELEINGYPVRNLRCTVVEKTSRTAIYTLAFDKISFMEVKSFDEGYDLRYGEGFDDGYDSGYTIGYDSGYTAGQIRREIRIDGHSEWDNTKQGVWAVYGYSFNGGEMISPVPAIGMNEGQGISYDYRDGNIRYFGISGITMEIESIRTVDLDLGFYRKESDRTTPATDELNLTINDIPLDIRSSSREIRYEAPGDNYVPQIIYRYHYNIRTLIPSQYGIGYDDGYQSGYTVGYEDGYSAERPTDSIVITNNGVYTNPSGGWSSVIANVHEETPEILLQDLVVDLDYSSVSGFSGDETFVASEGYDGLNSVEVRGMSAALYHANLNNTWEGATGGLNNAYYASASTLEITENGTYTASGTGRYEEGRHSCQFPLMFKEVRVNVPVSNICVSGSFTTTANTTFSPSDENVPFLVNMPPIQCLSNLKVDGVAMQTYCENSYMLPAGDHIFWMNYGMLALTNGNPVTFTNSFPNAESITYSRIHQE